MGSEIVPWEDGVGDGIAPLVAYAAPDADAKSTAVLHTSATTVFLA